MSSTPEGKVAVAVAQEFLQVLAPKFDSFEVKINAIAMQEIENRTLLESSLKQDHQARNNIDQLYDRVRSVEISLASIDKDEISRLRQAIAKLNEQIAKSSWIPTLVTAIVTAVMVAAAMRISL